MAIKHALSAEPVGGEVGPAGGGRAPGAQTVAVATRGENVEGNGAPGGVRGLGENGGVAHFFIRIIVSLRNKKRRCVGSNGKSIEDLVGIAVEPATGIDEDGEGGTREADCAKVARAAA